MARRFSEGQRKVKQWSGIVTNGVLHTFTGDATILTGALAFVNAATVIRMLGEYIIMPTSAPAAADVVTISVGIGVVSTDAAAAGAASMPDPDGELEFPWLYWASHPIRFGTTGVSEDLGSGVVRVPFDIHSMRKLKPRESLAVITQYTNLAGNPPMEVFWGATRVLLAIH